MMAGFNVGPSNMFMGKVARPQPNNMGGGRMNPGMGQNMGVGMSRPMSNSGIGGGMDNGMGMPPPNRYPSPQPVPPPQMEPGIAVAPSTGANLPPGAVTNGMMGSQAPIGGAPPINYSGGGIAPMTPPAYTPPNANPQSGLFNRFNAMRGNRM
jgi:hypothetical protein